jgi:hypothetical protein
MNTPTNIQNTAVNIGTSPPPEGGRSLGSGSKGCEYGRSGRGWPRAAEHPAGRGSVARAEAG